MDWNYLREALSPRYSERILAAPTLRRMIEEEEIVGTCPRCERLVFATTYRGYCSADCEAK